ncbi:MAG: Fe2+-dependent dioxygenase [Gammaproteobacteria bacterium]|nr:MAG: Fe2+-dependent dioxygenase [Gammaproteobacteria bacterium]
MIAIPNVLSAQQLAAIHSKINQEQWVDGRTTGGQQANSVKNNQQLPTDSAIVRELEDFVLSVLAQNPVFISAALPLKIFPPMINRYGIGETYGVHVDNAIRVPPGTGARIRTDLSATLFLSDPDSYDGGELMVEDHFSTQPVKLAAGDLILYPSTSLHQVTPVTKGERISMVFWLQSMIRDNEQRKMLFDLDQSVQSLTAIHGHEAKDVMRLSGIYHNLIREWADT